MLGDLQNPKWMYLKATLLLLVGTSSGVLLILERPTLQSGLLILLVAWSFSRAYYFAFYVIQSYIDPGFRFAGLVSLARYLVARNTDE